MRASSPALQRPPPAAPGAPRPPKPRAIGGWSALAAVTLLAWPLVLVLIVVPATSQLRISDLGIILVQRPDWVLLEVWTLGSTAGMAALSLWTIPKYLARRRVAIPLMIRFFSASLVVGVINCVVEALARGPGLPPADSTRVLLFALVCVLWIRYFRTSTAVQETFARP